MYHEIEGQYNMPTLIFVEDRLMVGNTTYNYSEIEELTIIPTPIFATYGILNLKTEGKDISIPFVRSRMQKLKQAIREFEHLRNTEPGVTDSYEELKKLKELLDLSIITEEEFAQKKKELLGL